MAALAPVVHCGSVLQRLTSSAGGDLCARDAGFAVFGAILKPSTSAIEKLCASSRCKNLLVKVTDAVPNECLVSSSGGIQLYRDVVDVVNSTCSLVKMTPTPSSTTRPSTTTASRMPRPSLKAPASGSSREEGVDPSDLVPQTLSSSPPPTAFVSTTSPSTTATSPASTSSKVSVSSQGEPLDANLLLVIIMCGVVVVAVVGFVAFHFDRKRSRDTSEPLEPELVILPRRLVQQHCELECGDSSDDHFSPRPVWGKL